MDGHPTNPDNATAATRPTSRDPRKPRSECTLTEIAKLDAEVANKRGRQAKAMEMKASANYVVEVVARHQARHPADVEEKDSPISKAHTLLMLGLARPPLTILSVAAMAVASTELSVCRPPKYKSPSSSSTPGTPPY
ncbi:hypothetical protein D1007_47426 [Hordeum vulgare]|nr:hypothetical protein D1007_47426 [Hordeum vulgare]